MVRQAICQPTRASHQVEGRAEAREEDRPGAKNAK